MADGVTVDLGALTTFASTMGTVADLQSHAVGDSGNLSGLSHLMRGSTGAPQGGELVCYAPTGFVEAEDFTARHDVMAQSALQFMTDAVTGLAALALGAETCAMRYAATDRSNASALRGVTVAGSGGGTFAGLTVHLSGQAAVSTSDVTSAFSPTGDNVMISSPVLDTGPRTPAGLTDPVPATPTWAVGRPTVAPTAGGGQAQAPIATAPVGRTTSGANFDAEVAAKVAQLKKDGAIQPDEPTRDPGQGITIGHDPTLQVQPDQAPMPASPQVPHTVVSH